MFRPGGEGPFPHLKQGAVYTDWLLVRRLAWELNRRFAGGKVRDAGRLEDGRFALAIWRRGETALVCLDAFAPTPAVTVGNGELPVAAEPGFVRAAVTALRGTTLLSVRSRKNDRLLRFDFGTRSRFGVEDSYSIVCELVPRFGNIVLLKGETVVAAAKEFGAAENKVRSVEAGDTYEPPPLRPGNATPLLSPDDAKRLAQSEPDGDLYVYRRDGAIVQAHLAPVEKFAGLPCEREPSLLEIFAQTRNADSRKHESDAIAKRRRELTRILDQRERKLQAELAQADAGLARAAERGGLREQGEAIFATLHELAGDERDAEKERAAKLFGAYKKASASVAHLERRRAEMQDALADVRTLRWELERVDDARLEDAAAAIAGTPERSTRKAAVSRKRKPAQFTAPGGSRVFVGRSPLENAELTFRIARPDDLWFHVQNQPGAHVILQRDDKGAAPQDDIEFAAALAAYHSKAKESTKVTVDYTQRKHVRKRPAAAPGLVFYTHPKSVRVEPRSPRS